MEESKKNGKIIKLFGVEIYVVKADEEEVLNNPKPPEYSTPTNEKKKRKSSDEETAPKSWARRSKQSTGNSYDQSLSAVLPLEEIPGLVEIIGSQNGSTKPVFLYRKNLTDSDVRSDLNRLLVNEEEKLMEFLSKEENTAVSDNGIEFFGIDTRGKMYKLRYVEWGSMNRTAINKEWSKLVFDHSVKRGDWVEIWGYRVVNNEIRFVVNFRKDSELHA